MATDNPPPPPVRVEQQRRKASDTRIADMRDAFARKTPQTDQNRADARAFIDGKIEMVRRDQQMTKAEKAAAILSLEARRDAEVKQKPKK
jgi:hypothetical protein